MAKRLTLFERRRRRVRSALRRKGSGSRVRLSVFRSGRHIYAQMIDDVKGVTLAHASSLDKELKLKHGAGKDAATKVGELIAKRVKAAKLDGAGVVFDRGGYPYHGRVKALAEGARSGGLKF